MYLVLDVKMAAEGRASKRTARRPSPPPRYERERSPMREASVRGHAEDAYRRPSARDPLTPPPRDPYLDRDPYR